MTFEATKGENRLQIAFSSTLDNVDLADDETSAFLSSIGLKAESFGLRLAIREGLVNAVRHGNCCDPDRITRFSLHVEGKRLLVDIEDEGPGFDWRTGLRKALPLKSDNGRGLHIMRQYNDDVCFNDKGNRLTLVKRLDEDIRGVTVGVHIQRGGIMSEIVKKENQTVIRPGQDVVASMAKGFRTELASLVEEGVSELLIDMTGVEMVDSVGLGVFVASHNSLNKVGGKLVVANATPDIRKLFQAMRLDQHFEVRPA